MQHCNKTNGLVCTINPLQTNVLLRCIQNVNSTSQKQCARYNNQSVNAEWGKHTVYFKNHAEHKHIVLPK
jgi:hypothetical protein